MPSFLSPARRRVALGAGLLLAALGGCAVARLGGALADAPGAATACFPFEPTPPLPGPVLPAARLLADTLLRGHFSPPTLAVANRYGLAPTLHQVLAAPPGSLTRLALRQRLAEQLASLALAASSTAAALDCEEERADQVADYLLDQAARRTQRYTLLSILLGAAGTVVTGLLALLGARKGLYRPLGIGFGLAGAALGLLTLYAADAPVRFQHPRNALADVGRDPASPHALPAAVWAYLTTPTSAGPTPATNCGSAGKPPATSGPATPPSAAACCACCSVPAAATRPASCACGPTSTTSWSRAWP